MADFASHQKNTARFAHSRGALRVWTVLVAMLTVGLLLACGGGGKIGENRFDKEDGARADQIAEVKERAAAATDPDRKAALEAEAARLEKERAQAKAKHEAEEKERRGAKEAGEKRVADLWRRHGRNFVAVDGKVRRIPSGPDSYGLSGSLERFHVLQVIDDENVLVEVTTYSGLGNRQETWWLTHVSTEGVVDGKDYGWGDELFTYVGTKRYKTAIGGTRTVRMGMPNKRVGVTLEEFREVLASGVDLGPDQLKPQEEAAERARREAEEEERERKRKEDLAEQTAKHAPETLNAARRILGEGKRARDVGRHEDAVRLLKEADRLAAMVAKVVPESEEAQAIRVECAGLLARERREDRAREDREEAEQEADRKLALAKQLLEASKAEKAKKHFREADDLLYTAKERCRQIIAAYPKTKAAEEAKKLLEEKN
jgi:hypothetical protein